MSFGLLDTGFARKRLEDIISDIDAKMTIIYGTNLDLEPDAPQGALVGLFGGASDEIWEVSEEFSKQFSPQEAVGAMLSQVVQLNGLKRIEELRSFATCSVTSTEATIPIGSRCSNDEGDEFENLAVITIAGGTGSGIFTAVDRGPIPVDANTLTTVVTQGIGWTTANNPTAGTLGVIVESDPTLRNRRERSVEQGATNSDEALTAALLALANVTEVRVIDRKESDADPITGTAGHSARCVVLGGIDADIREVIWPKMPLGIKTSGAVSGTVLDFAGKTQPVEFQRPTETDIYMDIKTRELGNFPPDGVAQIRQSILDAVAGLIAGRADLKLGIGDSVIHGQMGIGPNTIPGHAIWEWSIGLAPAPTGKVNIDLDAQTLSRWDGSRITVTVQDTAP